MNHPLERSTKERRVDRLGKKNVTTLKGTDREIQIKEREAALKSIVTDLLRPSCGSQITELIANNPAALSQDK